MTLLLQLLLGCGTPPSGTVDDTSTTCNEANEACSPATCEGEGGQMLPGADCLACHGGSGIAKEEDEAPRLGSAGTAFVDVDGSAPLVGALVRITDADGAVTELTTNAAGNFYSTKTFTFPIEAEVEVDGEVRAMAAAVDEGSCNSCHACEGAAGGKLTH